MILPIVAYGNKNLRDVCSDINEDYMQLDELINNMWETMNNANGCGLAAPQVGKSISLFIVDSETTFQNMDDEVRETFFEKDDMGIKEVFINARIISSSKEVWNDDEGCLSIPGLSQPVPRPWAITIEYCDRNFTKQKRTFYGATARMVQHEYDHTNGVLYFDYLKPLTKKLIAGKLNRIAKGDRVAKYPMI